MVQGYSSSGLSTARPWPRKVPPPGTQLASSLRSCSASFVWPFLRDLFGHQLLLAHTLSPLLWLNFYPLHPPRISTYVCWLGIARLSLCLKLQWARIFYVHVSLMAASPNLGVHFAITVLSHHLLNELGVQHWGHDMKPHDLESTWIRARSGLQSFRAASFAPLCCCCRERRALRPWGCDSAVSRGVHPLNRQSGARACWGAPGDLNPLSLCWELWQDLPQPTRVGFAIFTFRW